MPISEDDIMKLLCDVSERNKMQATVKHWKKAALAPGAMAFLGGLVSGPPGIAVGATLGGLLGALMRGETFEPVPQILMKLSSAEKKKLFKKVTAIIKNLDCKDAVQLTPMNTCNESLQLQLVGLLVYYFTKELGADVRFSA